ncbi:unnamed protein product [Rhizopus stolonifer]
MDRYARGYDDRYRGYYSRPRSEAYRPNDGYRSDRDYRDPGGRNHSPNPHYSSSQSPARDGYPKDHRYSYSEARSYPGHYSSSSPPPPRSDSNHHEDLPTDIIILRHLIHIIPDNRHHL